MTTDIHLLILTAASAGFVHTLLGPDHYLPFVLIGKAREWRISKVLLLTLFCGLGHIVSSVLLGVLGIFFGIGLEKLNFIESARGNLASWALIAFGLIYAIWGLQKVYNAKKNTHHHLCKHNHNAIGSKKTITPWVLFIIFVLGPCEILIPLLMYPAAHKSMFGMLMVTSVFGITTLFTMLSMVVFLSYGASFVLVPRIKLYTHFIAGLMIFISGLAIQIFSI